MRLWIGLTLPLLPLEVFRPTWLADTLGAHAVLESNKVIALSPAARQAGVRPGMRRAGVAALAPGVLMSVRDPARERATLDDVALALLRFTPQLARFDAASLVLEISASVRLFGGLRALYRQVGEAVQALGLSARLALAPSAAGAWLLAQQPARARRRLLRLPALARRLDATPAARLPAAQPLAQWLEGIGCSTLGELRRLPRAGLKRRGGAALLEALDRAYGEAPENLDWVEAPLTFTGYIELPDRAEYVDALSGAGQRLVLQMTGWLTARHKAVAGFVLLLEHERGRAAMAPTAVPVLLAEPTWHPTHLMRLLKERLARTTLAAPVIALRLVADDVREMLPESDTLFADTGASSAGTSTGISGSTFSSTAGGKPGDAARLIELLTARLGTDSVLHFSLVPDHRPEIANTWLPLAPAQRKAVARSTAKAATKAATKVTAKATGRPTGRPTDSAPLPFDPTLPPRPCWLLDAPLALLTRKDHPFYGAPLTLLTEHERVEAGWWDDKLVTRDYFVAQAPQGMRYWIFRERRSGPQADAQGGWFLHGLFG